MLQKLKLIINVLANENDLKCLFLLSAFIKLCIYKMHLKTALIAHSHSIQLLTGGVGDASIDQGFG